MARRATSTTHRDEASRDQGRRGRLLLGLAVWVSIVAVVGVLHLSTGPGRATAVELAMVPADSSEAAVVPEPTTTATTATTVPETTTTVPPTTAPPATVPPATVPAEPRSAAPAPAPAPEVVAEPAPPVTAAPAPTPAPTAAGVDAAAEQQLLNDHNARRAAAGLPPLQRNSCLDALARNWSAQMAGSSDLHHNPGYSDGVDDCMYWTAVAENVGYAGDAGTLASMFWNSPEHHDNIMGNYEYVGIGVVVGADGTRWATLNFSSD